MQESMQENKGVIEQLTDEKRLEYAKFALMALFVLALDALQRQSKGKCENGALD